MRGTAGLMLVALATLLLAGCKDQRVRVEKRTIGKPDGTLIGVNYGFREQDLRYVVFEIGRFSMTNQVHGWLTWNSDGFWTGRQYVNLPNGGKLDLAASKKVVEIRPNGQINAVPLAMTLDSFEAFLKSNPTNYSIESLRDWQKRR